MNQLLQKYPPEELLKTIEQEGLVYVTDRMPGITRIRRGKGFFYLQDGIPCTDKKTLSRIKGLVIPPAWTKVWICSLPNGHLQATGYDKRNRKQYRYHPQWNRIRNETKFHLMIRFSEKLPEIREQVEKDLALPGMPLNKVLAIVVSLMENTCIRIGNVEYERLYGSYGLTTLRDRHVKVNGASVQFRFKGKKGVLQEISVLDKRLAKLVNQCRDIPGYELFQYVDENGKHHNIDSGMVNSYIKAITRCDFTAKDFRTWAGTVHALKAFLKIGVSTSEKEIKKNLVAAIDMVSTRLGNTRSVCRKYYIHPAVIEAYERGFPSLLTAHKFQNTPWLSSEEQLLLKLLKS